MDGLGEEDQAEEECHQAPGTWTWWPPRHPPPPCFPPLPVSSKFQVERVSKAAVEGDWRSGEQRMALRL
jgi:hypothetical protein